MRSAWTILALLLGGCTAQGSERLAEVLAESARDGRSGFESFGGTSVVSGPVETRVALIQATAAELERSLLEVEGVIEARVHLAHPLSAELTLGEAPEVTGASVLLVHGPDSHPNPDETARFVAGSVDGLSPESVAVLTSVAAAVRLPPHESDTSYARVGPIAVQPASKRVLQAILIGLCGVILALGVALFRGGGKRVSGRTA